MRKVILLAVVLAVIAAGWFLYFHNPEQITKVSVSHAKIMNLSNTLEFSGKVVPVSMYSVMSETGGTVEELYVSEGDTVTAGDDLFSLDASQLERQLDEAQLKYDMLEETSAQSVMAQNGAAGEAQQSLLEQQAKVALALSQTTGYDFESFNEAFAQTAEDTASQMASALDGLTTESIETLAATADIGSDEIALAALSVESLQEAIDNMYFSSLIDGTVIAVNINAGEVLAPGVPALVIADTSDTVIEGYVYEKDVSDLEEGQQVKIDTESRYYLGAVTAIGKAAGVGEASDYGAMTKVEITPNGSFSKMPGAAVDLEVLVSSKKSVLAIPLECIAEDGCVYIVNAEGIVEKRAVRTGFKDMYDVEILDGVAEGETAILSPDGIEDGQQVAYD